MFIYNKNITKYLIEACSSEVTEDMLALFLEILHFLSKIGFLNFINF